jgi:hypothetical protein
MSSNKPFDSAVLAARIYKARSHIYGNIRKNRTIERYLISTRSRRDFVAFYKIRLTKANAGRLYGYLVRYPRCCESSRSVGSVHLNPSKLERFSELVRSCSPKIVHLDPRIASPKLLPTGTVASPGLLPSCWMEPGVVQRAVAWAAISINAANVTSAGGPGNIVSEASGNKFR